MQHGAGLVLCQACEVARWDRAGTDAFEGDGLVEEFGARYDDGDVS